MSEKLYKVLVEREYYHSTYVDIKAKSKVEARRKALEALRKNQIELDDISEISDTDKVLEVDDEVSTRCQECDSSVIIPYQPNSKVKCPRCNVESETNVVGYFVWN